MSKYILRIQNEEGNEIAREYETEYTYIDWALEVDDMIDTLENRDEF